MKWFNLLKSKSGKLVLTTKNAVLISSFAGVAFTIVANNVASNQVEKELAARNITSISDVATPSGGRMGQKATQIRDSLGQLATAEERRAREGNSAASRNFEMRDEGEISRNLQGQNLGRAAALGETDGLETNPKDVTLSERTADGTGQWGESARHYAAAAQGADYAGAANRARHTSPTQVNTLSSASMAHASGSVINAAGIAMSGSSGSRNSNGYEFTGALPGGSSALAALNRSGQGAPMGKTSGFSRDTNANSRGGSSAGKGGKDNLYYMAKRSMETARNSNRASNEGNAGYMDSKQKSGGMSIEGGLETESTGSTDFGNQNNTKLKKINAWAQQKANENENRNKARGILMLKLAGLLLGAAGALFGAARLLTKAKFLSDMAKSYDALAKLHPAVTSFHIMAVKLRAKALGLRIAGGAILGALTVATGFVVDQIVQFNKDYPGETLLVAIGFTVTAAVAGATALTAIKPSLVNDLYNKGLAEISKFFKSGKVYKVGGNFLKAKAGAAVQKGVTGALKGSGK